MDGHSRYCEIEHTADVGIETTGGTLEELFANAAWGFTDMITDASKIRATVQETVRVSAQDTEELLVRWLNEFLYLFDTRRLLFSTFRIEELDERHISAVCTGEVFDPGHHTLRREIKAVTYHGLRVWRQGRLWMARVICDI